MQDNIHPVSNNQTARTPANYEAPACPRGCIEYEWNTDLTEPVVCHLDYEPAERGSRELGTGLQLEPDTPENVTLEAAYLRGLNISTLLSDDQVEDIKTRALDWLRSEREAV